MSKTDSDKPVKPFAHTYVRLTLAAVLSAAAVAALGYYPTLRLAGPQASGAMLAGIAISLVAVCVGALPIGLAAQGDPTKRPQAILMATAVRFVVVLALTVSVVFSGWFDRAVFGLWVAISYLALLFVDTILAVRIMGCGQTGGPAAVGPHAGRDHP